MYHSEIKEVVNDKVVSLESYRKIQDMIDYEYDEMVMDTKEGVDGEDLRYDLEFVARELWFMFYMYDTDLQEDAVDVTEDYYIIMEFIYHCINKLFNGEEDTAPLMREIFNEVRTKVLDYANSKEEIETESGN